MELPDITKKANKRMYFLILLSRAHVPAHNICFYFTCIRPVLEYCAPLCHHALSDYLTKDMKRIQKHALSIISPGRSYGENLSMFNMVSLEDRRNEKCHNLFESNCTIFFRPRTSVLIISEDDASQSHRQLMPPFFDFTALEKLCFKASRTFCQCC